MNRVMFIVAHPDDEWLGCGGTILKHIDHGDLVQVIFMSDGYSSRVSGVSSPRNYSSTELMKKIGAENPIFFQFPDNRLDTVPLLELVQKIELCKDQFQPNVVYTHFNNDLNIDHKVTCMAAHTAFRPQPGEKLQQMNLFEVVSSSEWSCEAAFKPNLFNDISKYLDKKIELLSFYEDEIRQSPHARSYENIKTLAKLRGNTVGLTAAESFQISRLIK